MYNAYNAFLYRWVGMGTLKLSPNFLKQSFQKDRRPVWKMHLKLI